ncbi:hypothetical protein DdX_11764 [Ditylenchus destructor]|uniref:Uncharacterized protein n=1 Tax=Ditylenchus destructor TaxID=166010 RepID=A0AAD4R107_9BILA|nr:hypothetical protein DdX_11764 [Ditylenchus destructor]
MVYQKKDGFASKRQFRSVIIVVEFKQYDFNSTHLCKPPILILFTFFTTNFGKLRFISATVLCAKLLSIERTPCCHLKTMVANKVFVSILCVAILCVLVPVKAQDHYDLVAAACSMNHQFGYWHDDEVTEILNLYRTIRPLLNANVDDKRVFEIIKKMRKKKKQKEHKCNCAAIGLNIAIGFASLAAILLQKMGTLGI